MLWRDLKVWQVYGANTDVGKTVISTVLCKALRKRAPTNGLLYLKPVSTGPSNEADDQHITRHAPGVLSKCISQFQDPVSPHIAAQRSSSAHKLEISDESILSRVKAHLENHAKVGGRFALLETAGGVLSPGPSGSVQADLYRPLRLPTLLIGDSKLGGISATISAFESLFMRGYDVDSVVLFEDNHYGNHEYLQRHFQKHDIHTYTISKPPDRLKEIETDARALSEYYDLWASSSPILDLVEHMNQKHFSRISKLTALPAHAESVIWHPFRQHGIPQNIIAIDSAYGDHFQAYNQESDQSSISTAMPGFGGLTQLTCSSSAESLLTPLLDGSSSWWTQGVGHGNPELALVAARAAGRYGHVMFASAIHQPAIDISHTLLDTLQNPRLARVFFSDNGSTAMEVALKMALRASCHRYGWEKNDRSSPVGILGLKGSYHGDTIGVMNCSEPSVYNDKVDWYAPWGYWFEPPQIQMRRGVWELDFPPEMNASPGSKKFTSLHELFDFASRQVDEEVYCKHITDTLHKLVQKQGRRFGALVMEPLIMGAGGMIFVDPLFQRILIKTIRGNPDLIAKKSSSANSKSSQLSALNPFSKRNGTSQDGREWTGLPVIADEVFTGLYRLGRGSSSSFLKSNYPHASSTDIEIAPDISAHAKLLTGGLLPLAITCASTSIFNTFLSSSKSDALLHGHSYTAHPIGCAVANWSLKEYSQMDLEIASNSQGLTSEMKDSETDKPSNTKTALWKHYKDAWASDSNSPPLSIPPEVPSPDARPIYAFISPATLSRLSNHPRVESCFAIGTVLSLRLRPHFQGQPGSESVSDLPPHGEQQSGSQPAQDKGYTSSSATSLQQRLLGNLDETGSAIHSRTLGDVIYFMTSLTTAPQQVERLNRALLKALDEDLAGPLHG